MSGPAKIFLVQGQYLLHEFFITRKSADEEARHMRLTTGYKHWHAYAYVPAKKSKPRQGVESSTKTGESK